MSLMALRSFSIRGQYPRFVSLNIHTWLCFINYLHLQYLCIGEASFLSYSDALNNLRSSITLNKKAVIFLLGVYSHYWLRYWCIQLGMKFRLRITRIILTFQVKTWYIFELLVISFIVNIVEWRCAISVWVVYSV